MAVYDQIRRALQKTEQIAEHGLPFVYPGAAAAAVGVLGVPHVDVKALTVGPQTKTDATFTVRKAWFAKPPTTQKQLEVDGRKYLVTKITTDPVAYEFTCLDRGPLD